MKILCGIIANDAARFSEFWSCVLRLKVPQGSSKEQVIGGDWCSARNELARRCLEEDYDYLWFMDDDHSFAPDLLQKLLTAAETYDLPIVNPLCTMRTAPFHLVTFAANPDSDSKDRYLPISLEGLPGEGIVELEAGGCAGMLIRRDVLEATRESEEWDGYSGSVTVRDRWFEYSDRSEDIVFCIPPGAWVDSRGPLWGDQWGTKRIEEIVVGDFVRTHTGSLGEVRDTSTREYEGNLVCITPAYGDSIKLTPNHRLLVKRGDERTWLNSGDVITGDTLCVPKPDRTAMAPDHELYSTVCLIPDADDDGETIGYTRTRKTAIRIPKLLEMTSELGRLLGYFIAEGTVDPKRQRITLCFGAHETDYVDDAISLLEDIFGASPTTKTLRGCTRITVCSAVLTRVFCGMCDGATALEKRLPGGWQNFEEESLRGIIKGYWRGDGSYDDRNGFRMTTASPRLAADLRAALLQLGIYVGVRFRPNETAGRYDISIPYPETKAFARLIDEDASSHIGKDAWSFLKSDDGYYYVRVMGVSTEWYKGPVHNLSIVGDESFTISGFSVHNCEKAKAAGFKIYADLSARLGHITTAVIVPALTENGWETGITVGRDLQLAIGTAEQMLREQEVEWVEDPRNRDDNPHPEEVAQVQDPCGICGRQSSWGDPVGTWMGCEEHHPEHEAWGAERIEIWVDEEFRWWWRAIDHRGQILKKDSAVSEASVISQAHFFYPGAGVHQVQREADDSRNLRQYGLPGRMFNREVR